MPFDFPTNPASGTTHTEFGVDYVWDGSVWNLASGGAMTDYVLKAGDSMTGSLGITANAGANGLNIGTEPGVANMGLTFGKGGGTDYVARITTNWIGNLGGECSLEFWTRNGGYGWMKAFNTVVGSPPTVTFTGRITAPGVTLSGGGIIFPNTVVSDQNDCRNHIRLWTNTADAAKGFGLSVTSGRQNYTTDSASNMHCFMCGDTQAYMIDTAGATGNMVSGTSFVDRSLRDDPTLASFIEGEDVKADAGGLGMSRRGVTLGKLLLHALAEIAKLKPEIAALKPQPRGGSRR